MDDKKPPNPVKYAEEVPELHRLGWAAGFIDGEGCFHVQRSLMQSGRRRCAPGLTVSQVRTEPLEKLSAVLGIGTLSDRVDNGKAGIYHYRVYGFEGVQYVVALLWNFMTLPKREQARRVLLETRNHEGPKSCRPRIPVVRMSR